MMKQIFLARNEFGNYYVRPSQNAFSPGFACRRCVIEFLAGFGFRLTQLADEHRERRAGTVGDFGDLVNPGNALSVSRFGNLCPDSGLQPKKRMQIVTYSALHPSAVKIRPHRFVAF